MQAEWFLDDVPAESPLFAHLNPSQREAVAATEGPVLVVAGAGSGKTRVLTYRIAHLLRDLRVAPEAILAITFTNKAADEMRGRVGALVGGAVRSMWVSTFHSACVRILRREASRLGYRSGFSIYDDADSLRLINLVLKDLDVSAPGSLTWERRGEAPGRAGGTAACDATRGPVSSRARVVAGIRGRCAPGWAR
jgi:superfamily I DNA/RNA helicase